MATLDLDSPGRDVAFLISRALAIQSYASLEFSMSMLFSHLMGVHVHEAGIVYFQIVNSKSRNRVISDLLARKHGNAFEVYWSGAPGTKHNKGLWGIVRALDQRRNEIVHWHTMSEVHLGPDGQENRGTYLVKPDWWSSAATERAKITASDMTALFASGRFAGTDEEQTWRDICSRPCVFPPVQGPPRSGRREAP